MPRPPLRTRRRQVGYPVSYALLIMLDMQVPNVNPLQYADAATMNTAFTQLASGVGDFEGKVFTPGLVRPDALSLAAAGLTVNYTAPSPFGVFFSSGRFATAHGSQTGADSNTGSVDFTPFVPAPAGSPVTAYMVVSYAQVLQNPISLPGPPAGNPGNNPNYSGGVGYTTLRDSLSFSATTAVPDNLASFELGRATLTSASVSVSLNTGYRQLSSVNKQNSLLLATTGSITLTPALGADVIILSGTTATLPSVTGSNGLVFQFINIGGVSGVIQTGSELIVGFNGASAGTTSIGIAPFGSVTLEGLGSINCWQVVGGNLAGLGYSIPGFTHLVVLSGSSGSFTFPTLSPGQNVNAKVTIVGGGGGGGGASLGGGGGGGGAAIGIRTYVPGVAIPYSIGSGGAGGASGSGGGGGGVTQWGALYTANGGGGGGGANISFNGGGSGGTATGGDLNQLGQPGSVGFQATAFDGSPFNVGGAGGANGLGQAGGHGTQIAGGGQDGPFPGAGGGGGSNTTFGSSGASGIIIIEY